MTMNMLLFFIAFLGVFALLNMYISRRFIAHLHINEKYKRYLRLFLYINYVGVILYMFARYSGEFPNWLFFLVSLSIGVVFLLFCTALVYDISRLILKYTPVQETRRDFFKRSLDISSLGVAATLSGRGMYEANFIQQEDVEVKLKNLTQPYKVVQLSDVHIGGLIDATFIADLVKRVNALEPDLIVITGDLVDIALEHAQSALDELGKLHAKYGTHFVVGNHEYFHDVVAVIDEVKKRDIHVLENESVYIGEDGNGFNLLGVYDVFGYRVKHHEPNLAQAIMQTKVGFPNVLLAHQPRYIDEVPSNGIDLILSGHTHGGQLYPFKALVKLQQPYIQGLHQHTKNMQIYVSKGTGFWGPPMRLGASSEITNISLVPA